jgi:CRISPR-associated protein Cas1
MKISNQAQLIMDIRKKTRQESEAVEMLKKIQPEKASDEKELLGMEGTASKIFFSTYFRHMQWKRREPRTKRDIANLLLDIGYTYLFNFVEAITSLYGFDIYCGVYHKFFYQRKSLLCDMVEPFRCIIDKRLRKAHNLGQINPEDFLSKNNQVFLSYKNQAKYTQLFVKDILEHKEYIFLFIQNYYRCFMKDKNIKDFPNFNIKGD